MKKFLPTLLLACPTGLLAQQATVATGGDATGTGGSVSYSVGQPAYTVVPGPTANVAQGVQQPFEISLITGTDELEVGFGVQLYPNPATDAVVLELGPDAPTGLLHRLFDARGAIMAEGRLGADRTIIDLAGLAQGTYVLSILQRDLPVRSYRIVKH